MKGAGQKRQKEKKSLTSHRFLLARLHMDSLADCFTVFELRQHLSALSGDLAGIYAQALQRMRRSRSHAQHKMLDKMLKWLSWAKRPLSIQELGHALSVVPGLGSISKDLILPSDTIRDITTWTAGLIFVDTRSLVRFIHPTTARFFYQQRESLFPNGDSDIAHICLDYLQIFQVRAPLPKKDKTPHFQLRTRQYPFLEYAVLCGWQHVARSTPKDDDHRATIFLQSQECREFLTEALYILDPTWSVGEAASPVHIASHLGLADVLSSLLLAGEDVDARDSFGATPLMYAVESRDDALSCVKTLLSARADASICCQSGSTALIRAVYREYEPIVDCLLAVDNIAINTVTTNWREMQCTALTLSLAFQNREIFRKLLNRADTDVNAKTSSGYAALHHASMRTRNTWALKGLLAHPKIVVDIESADKYTPLLYAAANGIRDSVQHLLDSGANLGHLDSAQGSILMRVVDEHHSDMAQLLIDKGADVNQRDFLGRNVLHSAAINRAWACLQILLKQPDAVDVNCQGRDGETPLHDACKTRDTTGAQLLVKAGARCDLRDSEGRTPVDIARLNEATGTLQILETAEGYGELPATRTTKPLLDAVVFDTAEVLEERIKQASVKELNTASAFYGPPLSRASARGRAHVVRMLLEAGADTEITNDFDRTTLFFAIAQGGDPDCIDALMTAGADINRPPCLPDPDLPWELALRCNNLPITFMLIRRGAIIPRSSPQLQKALLSAAGDDELAVVRRLVEEAGASPHLKVWGLSAIQIAEENEATSVLHYFAERVASQKDRSDSTDNHEPASHSDDRPVSDNREDEDVDDAVRRQHLDAHMNPLGPRKGSQKLTTLSPLALLVSLIMLTLACLCYYYL